MRASTIVTSLPFLLFIALSPARPAGAQKDKLVFNQTLAQKSGSIGGKISANCKIAIDAGEAAALDNFNANTSWSFFIEDAFSGETFVASGKLGDDPKYAPGKKSATIIEKTADNKIKEKITIKWSSKSMMLTLSHTITSAFDNGIVDTGVCGDTGPGWALGAANASIEVGGISRDLLVGTLTKSKLKNGESCSWTVKGFSVDQD